MQFRLLKEINKIRENHPVAKEWVYGDGWFRGIQIEVRMDMVRPIIQSLFRAAVERKHFLEIQKRGGGTVPLTFN